MIGYDRKVKWQCLNSRRIIDGVQQEEREGRREKGLLGMVMLLFLVPVPQLSIHDDTI